MIVLRDLYLEIDRIASGEPICSLFYGIIGVAVKDIKVGNPLFVEERTSHPAVESNIRTSVSSNRITHNPILPHITWQKSLSGQ